MLCAGTGASERSISVIKHEVLPEACWEILCIVVCTHTGSVCVWGGYLHAGVW